MKVSQRLEHAFETEFEEKLSEFLSLNGFKDKKDLLNSERYLSRSIVPHVEKLSALFNRKHESTENRVQGLDPYWKQSSNPENLRLAYFLYFMPANMFRLACIWEELGRLGYRWPQNKELKAIEWGAGPAAGASGLVLAEQISPLGIDQRASWALIEQDRAMLELGQKWAEYCFQYYGKENWSVRPFHRKIDLSRPLLPARSPSFNLWVMSFFLNEFQNSPEELAESLLESWARHLDEEGLVIIIEPALKLQSRKLLSLRKALLDRVSQARFPLQILLPCLGSQSCGAFEKVEDWCHEEVSWWRAPYYRKIDSLAGLDRKTLPFSYLVLARSDRSSLELLPGLQKMGAGAFYRLVSPAHPEGQDLEFFLCGQEGKCRARLRVTPELQEVGRGDILAGTELRGDVHCKRIKHLKGVI